MDKPDFEIQWVGRGDAGGCTTCRGATHGEVMHITVRGPVGMFNRFRLCTKCGGALHTQLGAAMADAPVEPA